MRWHISGFRVTYGPAGPPVIALDAGRQHVADARFTDAPAQRLNVDPETRFVSLDLTPDERALLLDHLRNERAIVLDTEAGTLTFEPPGRAPVFG